MNSCDAWSLLQIATLCLLGYTGIQILRTRREQKKVMATQERLNAELPAAFEQVEHLVVCHRVLRLVQAELKHYERVTPETAKAVNMALGPLPQPPRAEMH